MTKEEELMNFLDEQIFNPILDSAEASAELKKGVRWTIMRMNERDAVGMVKYFWSAVCGTDKSVAFSRRMRKEGFLRFEEIIEVFRDRFNDAWIRRH
ncbi:hypothetical protein HGB07_06605 [Candidatus Roizmanbacteria bacterium]|nr:hypothetical protein [Candidatus Roizmanbacteria bacterium]